MAASKATSERFQLNDLERQSSLWRRVKAHIEERLAMAHKKNAKSMSIEKTEKLRGRIAELEYLAALDNPAPQTEADDLD